MNGNKTMKKTNALISKTLAVTLTYSMAFLPTGMTTLIGSAAYAQDGQSLRLPFCDTMEAAENAMCIDRDNHQISKFVKRTTHKGFLGIGKRKKATYVWQPLSSGELTALFGSYVSVSDASGLGCGGNGVCNGASARRVVISGGNGGGGGGNVVVGRGGNGGNGNGNGNGGVIVSRANGNGNGGNVIGRGDEGGRGSRGNGRMSVQGEYNVLNTFCGGVPDQLDAMAQKKKDLEAQVKDLSSGMSDLQKAVDDALAKVATNCRAQCITLAMTQDGACALPPSVIAPLLSKDDLNSSQGSVISTYYSEGSQSQVIADITSRSADQVKGNICSVVLGKDGKTGCLDDVKKNGMVGCDGFHDWLEASNALDAKQKALAQAQADLDKLNQAAADNCAIKTYADAKRWDGKLDTASVACVEKMYNTCPTALAQYDVRDSGSGNCANCGQDGGGGVYTNGGGNGQVVIQGGSGGGAGGGNINGQGQGSFCVYGPCTSSKAAQIISAIGGIGVPLGLGFMNMSMQNRALNACVSNYSQMIEVSKAVGLPPSASSCGLSYGMSGMSGIGSMGGMYGSMGSMYPSMYPAGGMSGMGMGLYGSLGLGMGMGNMGMGNMGMTGMGSMYPSMYPAGGMSGMGMYGMGNMGMMGMYGNAMGSMQGNMMGVQQQMYNAQLQMQQMAAQNMVLQNSMYGGMGGMGMSGMGMYGYPYYGMSGSYNPYGMYGNYGNGLNGSFGLNLNLGGSLGNSGYYNPYMLYGM